jgi:hypothetical protein
MFNWLLPLLHPGFWFDLNAVPFTPWFEKGLLIVLAASLVVGIGLFIYVRLAKGLDKDGRRMWRRFGLLSLCAGASGFLLYFFVWERVPVLSMRIFWVVWVFGFGYWKWNIWKEHFRLIPAEQAKAKEREAYEKWLPKPKK